LKKALISEKEFTKNKAGVRCFGYKHIKSIKFYSTLLLCLRDCYESKYEQLNIDMNYMLLLKNELSMGFLRNTSNITNTLRSAIKIYSEERSGRGEHFQTEMALLEKLFDQADNPKSTVRVEENKNSSLYKDPNDEPEPEVFKPSHDKTASIL